MKVQYTPCFAPPPLVLFFSRSCQMSNKGHAPRNVPPHYPVENCAKTAQNDRFYSKFPVDTVQNNVT